MRCNRKSASSNAPRRYGIARDLSPADIRALEHLAAAIGLDVDWFDIAALRSHATLLAVLRRSERIQAAEGVGPTAAQMRAALDLGRSESFVSVALSRLRATIEDEGVA